MFFSSFKKISRPVLVSGFTLFEMIVVIAIFTIVTGIVLANLPGFRSKTSLDLMAQEVALQIRGAQLYAMNTLVGNTGGSADTDIFGYALEFPAVVSPESNLFSLKKVSENFPDGPSPSPAPAVSGDSIENYSLGKNFKFSGYDICHPTCGTIATNLPFRLYFRRPRGEIYYCPYNSSSGWVALNSDKSRIKISTKDDSACRYVVVNFNGQIYVDPNCPS
ncbi:MAG: hypothetical protein UV64_C0006G0011 [Parcubacteria group bacterium GW2011_GWC1_43_11b]|uniref:Uncharacterized protein n=1 Tax=Candidatus Vogelbacteria bacterium RIFOXYB1_FULL_42_16 TaxID=1802436 RepID=A0A1G2QCR1_9BACT|nr:MAG: hypothetical protein UV50_C0004G0023 [Parcubacteria group bacterium GW2011_GWB1_42_9]KKS89431.1 MAG: hypothetical protein UV64_C0006G0011 [Parcubacteria group bacterium GW2011_GWC1_43_11b]KKT10018.1 MAG: hypothetical protein UV88_C0003G0020 [Parcubacteria group bacterium GW2011_GWA1_43_21]OHA58360.1 MAG: hypothetical protein A2370_01445 [Candidatus Vogelbacteria bacterium RIFOXYB1_FULL_42_16]